MVLYFRASSGKLIYMGKDKHENEDLIKYAWPEDVWFHVDNLSSAHVYLRLTEEAKDLKSLDPLVYTFFDFKNHCIYIFSKLSGYRRMLSNCKK